MKNAITPEILTTLKEGDPKAFETVFISSFNKVEVFIARLIKSAEDAGELAEEIFFHLWLHHSTLNTDRSFSSFISTIARNAAFNYLKHVCVEENYAAPVISLRGTDDPENITYTGDMALLIEMIVSKMPSQRQKVFRLCRIEGLSYDEVAGQLQIARKTVENQLSLAARDLRQIEGVLDPLKEILQEYLVNTYPPETENYIRNWIVSEENKERKIEVLSTCWNELQIEPDIFIYEALGRVKARIDEFENELNLSGESGEEETIIEEPVQDEPAGPATIEPEEDPIEETTEEKAPVIQLSPEEVEPIDIYENPLIEKQAEDKEENEEPEEDIVISEPQPVLINLEENTTEDKETETIAEEKTTVKREQKAPVWFTDPPVNEKKEKSSWWGIVITVLILLILLVIGGYVYWNQTKFQPIATMLTVNVPENEKSRIMLPDGTTVWLNSSSVLTYPDRIIENEHTVELKGEAFFEVTKEMNTPLKIQTAGLVTHINGGSVNITAYPQAEEIVILPAIGARVEIESESGFYALPDSFMFIWSKQTGDSIQIVGEVPLAPWKEN